ncbi:hypothetical protein N9Y90_00695 [Flavobacteriales bacterium]|nr:hypothetical protein [Flavobacteriales bacterium]
MKKGVLFTISIFMISLLISSCGVTEPCPNYSQSNSEIETPA